MTQLWTTHSVNHLHLLSRTSSATIWPNYRTTNRDSPPVSPSVFIPSCLPNSSVSPHLHLIFDPRPIVRVEPTIPPAIPLNQKGHIVLPPSVHHSIIPVRDSALQYHCLVGVVEEEGSWYNGVLIIFVFSIEVLFLVQTTKIKPRTETYHAVRKVIT